MPTTSARLGLAKPLTSDDFDTAELAANWQKVDDHPGIFICTAGTRPGAWGSSHSGMFIFETDTGLIWRWNGSAFVRQGPQGHLGYNHKTANQTGTGSYVNVVQVTVSIPTGGRNIQITASWPEVTGGVAQFALFRGATQLTTSKTLAGSGGSLAYVDLAPSSGSTTYAIKVKNASGTAVVTNASDSPTTIDVTEV